MNLYRLNASWHSRPCSRRPSDSGATAVEYALMVALIALVIFGAVAVVGLNLGDLFGDAAASFESF